MEKKNFDVKEAAKRTALNTGILIAALIGGFWGFLFILFARPIIQHACIALYLSLLALALLLANGYAKKKWFKWVAAGLAVIVAGFGIPLGMDAYHQSIPTVDDRYLSYAPYHPFNEATKAVTLPQESSLHLTYEEAASLRIDGATALYPVYASFARNVFEPSTEYYTWGEDRNYTLECSSTSLAYDHLVRGEADVIFCAAPSEQQIKAAESIGVQLHLTPVGREAFVFFVNSKNPVTGLTVEQIQRIYTGEITNWKDVGGKNQTIRAYQRDEGSGSQTALQMVMAELPLMEPDHEEVIDGMGGIFERVAAYRNYGGALGFSFRFYSNEMVGNNQIRLLALNGVEPTKDTIRDGSYPISSYFYAITASPIGEPAPEETTPTLKAFIDWCTGPQGQWVVEEVGYVGVDAAPAEDASTAPAADLVPQFAPPADFHWLQKADNFVFTVDEGGAIITGYLGSDEDVVIPDELGGCPVVSIANNAFSSQAFSGTSQLRTVTFPDTVTYIGIGAFQGRSKLERIIFSPESQLQWIDNSAFFDCPALTDVQLPGQVERIGHEAFGYCTGLTSFHIPASVTQMEVNPFPYCKALTSITVDPANEYFTVVDNMLIDKQPREIIQDNPNTVKTGLICLLSYPCGLTEAQITVPEGVTEIRQKAFFWCESLQNVTLPESLQAIGMSTFYGCTALEHVNLPAGLTHITTDPFGQHPESFTVTVTPYSYGEEWAIRNAIPFSY